MKYKVGDRVRIKSIDWYDENKNDKGIVACGSETFTYLMSHFCNKVVVIITIQDNCYRIFEDDGDWYWTDEMFEGLAEEETYDFLKTDKSNKPSLNDCMGFLNNEITLPQGYQFVDENGNVINATKIVLEKKKKEYPKTYEKCCKVLNVAVRDLDILDNMLDTTEIIYNKNLDRLLNSFRKLLICRDAYWKLYGEEMGLDKPWEFENPSRHYVFTIENFGGKIQKNAATARILNRILVFPTTEMRDYFYENFKELIEICKELL